MQKRNRRSKKSTIESRLLIKGRQIASIFLNHNFKCKQPEYATQTITLSERIIMAYTNRELIDALRNTADKLRQGADYAWGNHGACNCGNLLQSITTLTKKEILQHAHTGIGEWTELAVEYCGETNAPVSLLIHKLEGVGLTPTDIHNIEYLEDQQVLKALPGGFRWLKKNLREDVILYFETFAWLLEDKLEKKEFVKQDSYEFAVTRKYGKKENLAEVI